MPKYKADVQPAIMKKPLVEQSLQVAAYCRVSTDSEEQLGSLETQIKFYTNYIRKQSNWTLAGIYSDNAAGVRLKKRGVYQQMMRGGKKRKIDLILVKSISLAQAESQSHSENVKFGMRRRMESGRTLLNHTQFLGYTKGEVGELKIVPEEAENVRKIFEQYLQGNGVLPLGPSVFFTSRFCWTQYCFYGRVNGKMYCFYSGRCLGAGKHEKFNCGYLL